MSNNTNTILISDLNLSGMSSELIDLLREDFPEDNVIHEFNYSPELVYDFNQRIVTKENYKQLIDMYQFLLIDQDSCKKLAMDIAKLDLHNRNSMFLNFYNANVNNTFHSKKELKKAIDLYCENKEECEEKHGFIELWDVSNVTNMRCMFYSSKFHGDISNWDVSNVTDMYWMFACSQFHGDISQWNVSNVTNMKRMFNCSQFHGDISQWDVSNVMNMSGMFYECQFHGDISQWDVSNVTDMSWMFYNSQFNGDISNWDVSNVTNMDGMFWKSQFNRDISNWVKKPQSY